MSVTRDWVVDASVAVKWLVPEALMAEAREVLRAARRGRIRVHVPEIWLSEIASSLWKKTRRATGGRIEIPTAARLLEAARLLRVATHAHGPLVGGAFALACRSGLTVYDALYVALALREACPLVTADDRLANRVAGAGIEVRVVALSDIAAALS